MSKELIEKLREYADGEGSVQGYMAELMIQAADALEAKAAPVGEREAFEAWFFCPSNSLLAEWEDAAREAFQAGAAHQRQQGEYGHAYQGAREDLAIWKRRALEAEARVRQQDQIIDQMGEDLNAINGPTFMGEPVLPHQQAREVVMPEISAMAKVLSDRVADACNINRDDNWAMYGQEYIDDVQAMLAAAPSAPATVQGVNQQLIKALEAVLNSGRGTSGRIILDAQDEADVRAAIAAARQEGGKV